MARRFIFQNRPDVNNGKAGGEDEAVLGGVLELVLKAADLLDPVPGLPDGVLTLAFLHEALEDDPMGHHNGVFRGKHHFVENPFLLCK